jgi:hypothetical protein
MPVQAVCGSRDDDAYYAVPIEIIVAPIETMRCVAKMSFYSEQL